MNQWHALAILAVMAGLTFLLRAAPFVLRRVLRDNAFLRDLGAIMPIGVMTVLVIYSLKDVSWHGASWVAPVVGVAVTAVLHLWRRNVLLSLVGGIAVYAVLHLTVG